MKPRTPPPEPQTPQEHLAAFTGHAKSMGCSPALDRQLARIADKWSREQGEMPTTFAG